MKFRLARGLAAGALLAALAAVAYPGTQKKPTPPPGTGAVAPAPTRTAAVPTGAATWKEVDRLVSEQKYQEASRLVERLLADAERRGDSAGTTRALIRTAQLRMALHGDEDAVRFLKDAKWPADLPSRAVLELYTAQALVNYAQAYSWEISKRERVESRGAVDLKAWTREQIFEEAARSYLRLWKEREALGKPSVESLSEFVEPNDYPEGIRSTLRDAVAYFYAALLADTAGWTPAQSNAVFALDLAGLLKRDGAAAAAVELDDPSVHPLEKLTAVLADLESWHAGRGEKAGAFEARLERLRRLHAAFTEQTDRETILRDLEARLPGVRDVPWYAMGQAERAEFMESGDRGGDLVAARAAAEEGRRAYPDSIGGRRCLAIVRRIEAPAYTLETMRSDSPNRRSIRIAHKNVRRLELRAYALDLPSRLASARNMNTILPRQDEIERMIPAQRPAASWTVDLPPTPDYRLHATFAVPPMREKGLYVVAASGAPTFGASGFPVVAAHFFVSDLVLLIPQEAETAPGGARIGIRALSGETGRPVPGAEVSVYRALWRPEKVERVASVPSGEDGFANLVLPLQTEHVNRFVYARRGPDLALDLQDSYWGPQHRPGETAAAQIFTDRSIYRPAQKILWKVLAYRGDRPEGRLAVSPKTPITVTLFDTNNQNVASQNVVTNAFGSASGEFSIPTGRALGAWRISTSPGDSSAMVRVEEFKRPTFEVTLEDPAEPLRLNRPARLTGDAKYYFGLPVSAGQVRWRVARTPQFPWWYWWRGWGGAARTETVAAGTSSLQADGKFTLAFTPKADERLASGERAKGLTYSYSVEADVSDEGGETRSASRAFRLGFVAVEARVEMPGGFLREGTAETLKIVRTNLDGVGRAGKGSWRLVRLVQPETTLLPAEEPRETPFDPSAKTPLPGDLLRARWETDYSAERVMAGWKDGEELARGELTHDAKGEAALGLKPLPPGAYRLLYRTLDEFGAAFEMPKELVVAGKRTPLAVAAALLVERGSVPVGQTVRILAASGLPGQPLLLEICRDGRCAERRELRAGTSPALVEVPIAEKDRGGFAVKLTVLRDHQLVIVTQTVFVPWDDRRLSVSFATFRDRLRPGQRETWTVKVQGPDGAPVEAEAAELLASMYDRSLDAFVPHPVQDLLGLYPNRARAPWGRATLGQTGFQRVKGEFPSLPSEPSLRPDALKLFGGYAIGGMGRRAYPRSIAMKNAQTAVGDMAAMAPAPAVMAESVAVEGAAQAREEKDRSRADAVSPAEPPSLRSNFSETAFWKPHLLTGPGGSVSFEFEVPDSVTSWKVWVQAVTKDLKAGSLEKETKSVKELMVRPYVPRFLREGDLADLKVVVNNASERGFSGRVTLDVVHADTNASALAEFGLSPEKASLPFSAAAGQGSDLTFRLAAPKRPGAYAVRVTAVSGDFSDGELRPFPVLPGRMHLAQSRFAALREGEKRVLRFEDMAKTDDPTRIEDQLVVTVDGQLFYSLLSALPYLVNYPYECTEQTLNRFVSTGIVSSVFRDYPAVAKMAEELSKRETQLEPWAGDDPNRRMGLEETPWLEEARGGKTPSGDLIRVLDPKIAKADRETALAKLRKAQTDSGGFPWWPSGPPNPYMTLYILHGLADAMEFGVEVPRDMAQRAWAYLGADLRRDLDKCMAAPGVCEMAAFLNYTLSSYPDESWYAPSFDAAYRKTLLDYSFRLWKAHSPYLKGMLALTLKRMARPKDAKLVFDSIMDTAKTDPDLGTYFAPEDRSWLWYNDTVETQAFTLRALTELEPADSRRHGLVQWLFLNKKLNHWKSTRATAEAIHAVVAYLKKEGGLGVREAVRVEVGSQTTTFVFEPDRYTGKRNQVVVPGEKVDPARDSAIEVVKEGKGLAFASATWHFSTERLPEEERGDFFSVSRRYFLRESTGDGFALKPLADGAPIRPGDQIEVQISLRAKHAAEYVHLRDPRPAGAEPENVLSRYKWDLGIFWYEETRDSGANFFFERLPAGEYTFKHRIRANMAGTFRVAPAAVQSMYAPEFNAYSAGAVLRFGGQP